MNHNQQHSFGRLWDGFATDKEARQARDAHYRKLIKEGHKCRRWSLPNQVKKYDGFGQPNGAACTVYYITVYPQEQVA